MHRRLFDTLAVASFAIPLTVGCAAQSELPDGGSGGAMTSTLCVPGHQVACACPGGTEGIQVCNAAGTAYEVCACGSGTGGAGGAGGGTGGSGGVWLGCGDGLCLSDEQCHTCPQDCGMCAPCTQAPSCDNAQIPPVQMPHATDFDIGMKAVGKAEIFARLEALVAEQGPGVQLIAAALRPPRHDEPLLVAAVREALWKHPKIFDALDRNLTAAGLYTVPVADRFDFRPPTFTPRSGEFPGGTVECGAPLLRVRVAQVIVHEEDDDWENDIVYCALTSEAATASEIRITPETPELDEDESFTFAIEAGVFWGQVQPETPGGGLMLTYDCFEADSSSGYQDLINGIGAAAAQMGGFAGSYGWVFAAVGAVAPVISGALGMDGDDHLFNAQQTIPLDKQLDLTNGRSWSVRRSGTHNMSDWDWELRVEAWGCAEYGAAPQPGG